jgi:hypothetical protein
LDAAPLPGGTLSDGQYPEIWSVEKITSAFKLLEATTSHAPAESTGAMDSRTVAKFLLEKVRCIGNLLDQEDQPARESDFNELVFGTTSPPVPSQKELIYWYVVYLSTCSNSKFYFVFKNIGITVGGNGSFGK